MPPHSPDFAKTVLIALLASFFLGALLAPPDPFTQLVWVGGSLVVTIPATYWVLAARAG